MGRERGRGLCKRRQLVVLSESESKRGPDTVDKHLSLRLLTRACEGPVCAPPLPVEGYVARHGRRCSPAATPTPSAVLSHHCSSFGGKCERHPSPTTYTHPQSRAGLTSRPTPHGYFSESFQSKLVLLDASETKKQRARVVIPDHLSRIVAVFR